MQPGGGSWPGGASSNKSCFCKKRANAWFYLAVRRDLSVREVQLLKSYFSFAFHAACADQVVAMDEAELAAVDADVTVLLHIYAYTHEFAHTSMRAYTRVGGRRYARVLSHHDPNKLRAVHMHRRLKEEQWQIQSNPRCVSIKTSSRHPRSSR